MLCRRFNPHPNTLTPPTPPTTTMELTNFPISHLESCANLASDLGNYLDALHSNLAKAIEDYLEPMPPRHDPLAFGLKLASFQAALKDSAVSARALASSLRTLTTPIA